MYGCKIYAQEQEGYYLAFRVEHSNMYVPV